jgi:hypothetical protein
MCETPRKRKKLFEVSMPSDMCAYVLGAAAQDENYSLQLPSLRYCNRYEFIDRKLRNRQFEWYYTNSISALFWCDEIVSVLDMSIASDLTDLCLLYAAEYRSIRYTIKDEEYNAYLKHFDKDVEDIGILIDCQNTQLLTDIVKWSSLDKKLKRGDAIFNGDDYRNNGIKLWDGNKVIELYTEFDDYGTVPPDMTANSVGSSTFWEHTVTGHGANCLFNGSGYRITAKHKAKHKVNSDGVIYVLTSDTTHDWFLYDRYSRDRYTIGSALGDGDELKVFSYPCECDGEEIHLFEQFSWLKRDRLFILE